MMRKIDRKPADASTAPSGEPVVTVPEVASRRAGSVSSPRLKIRCPNCQKDGSARAELVNRRVSCKHCSFVFRAVPVDGEIAPPVPQALASLTPQVAAPQEPAHRPSKGPVEALELEVRQLRDNLSAGHAAAGEVQALRDQLDRALDAAKEAEAREQALRKEADGLRDQLDRAASSTGGEGHGGLREEELRFLRDQLDKARAEVEAETRRRRETAAALTVRTAEHAQALEAKASEHAQALASKEAEHGGALQGLRDQHERLRDEARAVEARRLGADAARTEAENRHADEAQAVRDDLDRARGELVEASKALDGLRLERDRLAEELESHRARLAEAERAALDHKDGAEGLRRERDRIESDRAAEIAGLRDQLEKALEGLAGAEAVRRERDEARIQRDRFVEELDALRARVEEAERLASDWGASTELEVPHAVASPTDSDFPAMEPRPSTFFDGDESLRAEAESLRVELVEANDLIGRKDAELADLALDRDRARAAAQQEKGRIEAERVEGQGRLEAELESLRRELEQARAASEATSRANLELSGRIQALESAPEPAPVPVAVGVAPTLEGDPASIEAERKRAVEEAVKGAWADFERRLAETQAKLKAANARADLMENEAREAREQAAARERGLDLGDGSSFEEAASMTSIRILSDRGTARLTLGDAEARLGLARQLAVDRKDKSLIDRIAKMADKVRADLESRNYTLAETLVRGAEIETGLDPGGFSINGLRIFRASPTIVGSLSALAPAFDRVMRQGDLGSIRSTLDEMRTILGDQAGLPEVRRPGRTPAIKRPIPEADAVRLFADALEAENWLTRPIASKKPLPDTSLTTYAALIEACADARKAAETHALGRVALLDGVIHASCLMLVRRQQADGHFSFIDPRGKASKLASVVEGMVAQRPDAVKDGWVIQVDPAGMAQAETGACAVALSTAGKALGRVDWTQAAQKAADWAMGQPCLPNFVANASSAGLLARAYLDAKQDRHLAGLAAKLAVGLLPGQVENGRWIDPASATTPGHLAILRALLDAWEAIPLDREDLRRDLKSSIDLAMASLLEECKALGVPSQGNALRDLLRHRDLFRTAPDPRLGPAILDSATVIQELCHEGPKPKLGVAPDQLAALTRI